MRRIILAGDSGTRLGGLGHEIAEVNFDLNQYKSSIDGLPGGTAWLDTGTFEWLLDAGNYVGTVEESRGPKVGVPEEASSRRGFISGGQFRERGELPHESEDDGYLLTVLDGGVAA